MSPQEEAERRVAERTRDINTAALQDEVTELRVGQEDLKASHLAFTTWPASRATTRS